MVEEPKYTGGGIFVFGGYVDSMIEGDARNFAFTATTEDARYLIIDALKQILQSGKAYHVAVIGPEEQEQFDRTGIRFRMMAVLLDHADAEIGDAVVMVPPVLRPDPTRYVEVPGVIRMKFEYIGSFPKVGIRAHPGEKHQVFRRIE